MRPVLILYRESTIDTKSHLFRMAGFEVKEATRGQDALDIVKRERPALLFVICEPPDITLEELYQRIKSDPATAATLVLLCQEQAGSELGYDGFAAFMDNALGQASSTTELQPQLP